MHRKIWQRWKAATANWGSQHQKHPKPWPLFKDSLKVYRDNWRLLVLVVLVVTIPVAYMTTYVVDPAADSSLAAYLNTGQFVMLTALIYTIFSLKSGRKIKAREAYYEGSGVIVRLAIISVIIALMLIPFLLGMLVFAAGSFAGGVPLGIWAQLLVIVIGLLLALPSFLMIMRSFWATYIVAETKEGPWQAIKTSRRITKGQVVIIASRVVVMALLLGLIILVPAAILAVLGSLTQVTFFYFLLQVVVTLIIFPLSNIYLYQYFRELRRGS